MAHDWIPSKLGHGESVCTNCGITNREAAALGVMNTCEAPSPIPTEGGKSVIDEIAAERRRQVEVEGWTPEHDDEHDTGELLFAAVCYAQRRMDEMRFGVFSPNAPAAWPWDWSWWKPTTRRRDLIKAAALLVAEIERLDRSQATGGEDVR